jgi:enoyl-[acyl-carrier protein] reductase I
MSAGLMQGRRGLVMGVANDHSIAWGIARTLAAHGAEIAFTYQGEAQKKRITPLAASIGSKLVLPGDVENDAELDAAFAALENEWGKMDFLVHAIAFSSRDELKGRYVDTSRANFVQTLSVSCYSFTAAARRAAPFMTDGGAMLTMTYLGGKRVQPNYNVMGVAKAALDASVKYLAADLGPDGIRVNAISAGPMRTLAGAGVGDARAVFNWNVTQSPLKKAIVLDHVGGAALYLLSDLSAAVTGEVHFVDGGYNIIGMPSIAALKGCAGPEGE